MTHPAADDRDDYGEADDPLPGQLDRFLAGESTAGLGLLIGLGLCCPLAPVALLLAGLGLMTCRTPAAREHSVLLLIVGLVQAVAVTMFALDHSGLGLF